MKNYFYKFATLTFILFAISFTSCEPESEPQEEEKAMDCPDSKVENYLAECTWFITDNSNAGISDIFIDFSNKNIYAYDAEENPVDEGNWSIEAGVISFNSLSGDLSDYVGDWTVLDCTLGVIKLKKGDKEIVVSSNNCEFQS